MDIKRKLAIKSARALCNVKEHGPTIAFVAGIGLSLWATIEAVKSTLRAEEELLEPAKAEFTAVENAINKEEKPDEYKSARTQVYIKTVGRGAKLYGKPLAIWSLAMVCLIGGWKTQSQRLSTAINFGVSAATALSTMHENTRQTFGDEVANALRSGEDIPGAIERCDFDKVRESATKKIRYSSDSLREYGDVEIPVSYRSNSHSVDPMILVYDKKHVKTSFWYKNPVDRLNFLKATENYLNTQLESGAVRKVSIKDIRDAIGYLDDDETPDDVWLGWWYNGETHPIDLGLGYLLNLLEEHKFDSAGDLVNTLEYVMIGDGHDCKREWNLVMNVMGNIYDHK